MLHRSPLLILWMLLLPGLVLASGAAGFAFEGWIGEGRPVFTAQQSVKSSLYREYSTSSEPAGVCMLDPGVKMSFSSSFVVATSPLKIAVEAKLERDVTSWGNTRVLSRQQYYDEGTKKTLSFPAGSSVELLMNRAEGACLFRSGGEVFQASCFDFPGVKSTEGATTQWWLQVECGSDSGWMLMDTQTLSLFKTSYLG